MFTPHHSPRLLNFCVCLLLVLPFLTTLPALAATPASISFVPGAGANGEDAIIVSGAGSTATLKDAQNNVPSGYVIEEVVNGQHIWTLTKSLLVQRGATLYITGGASAPQGAEVDWLRLRSDPNSYARGSVDYYNSFASLRTKDAKLLISGATITSWDTKADTYDTTITDGRAYVVAKGDSRMDITSSNLSYLGSADGESYGVAWRDTDTNSDGSPRTRVTGDVTDSIFSHNYYGLYTFQAHGLSFLRNKMFSNIEYGFDPHDYTHDVDVEDNEAYDNGSHGYIISRGCTNFTFLRNKSHDNKVRAGSKNPSAHGFMLDPGADPAKAGVPQAPSTKNVYMYNEAYNNDGYGFRILQSNNNTIQHNSFTNNRAGISLEGGSTGNLVDDNTISGSTGLVTNGVLSQGYGVQIVTGADANTVTNNRITNNAVSGITIKTGNSTIQGNTITGNASNGISITQDSGGTDETEPPADSVLAGTTAVQVQSVTSANGNQLIGNTISGNTLKGLAINGVSGTTVKGNTFSQNGGPGVSITGTESGTLVQANTISGNTGVGIEVYGSPSTTANKFTQNSVTNNAGSAGGAISVRNGANASMTPPVVVATGAGSFSGTTKPNAVVEVYSDPVDEAATYEGTVTANSSGVFAFTPASSPKGSYLTFLATDLAGNSSALSAPLAASGATATVTATPKSETATATATATATVEPSTTTTTTPVGGTGTNQGGADQFKLYLPVVIR